MQKGFTLIEIMIAFAIIGVLAAIALPSYQGYAVKVKRGDAKTEMMNIAQQLKRYQIANKHLANAKQELGFSSGKKYPDSKALYNITLQIPDPAVNNPREAKAPLSWVLTATPISGTSQQNDGILMLNSRGQKCWEKGKTTCTLSGKSKWSD